jgi:hypothetical protein
MERHGAPVVRHRWVTAVVEKVPQDAVAPPGSSAVDRQPAYKGRTSLIALWHFLQGENPIPS